MTIKVKKGIQNWFEATEDTGQDLTIHATHYKVSGEVVKEYKFDHKEVDGFGLIQKIFEENNIPVPKTAQKNSFTHHSIKQKFISLTRYLLTMNYKASLWKNDNTRSSSKSYRTYRVLSKELTKRIQQESKDLEISPFFFYFSKLDKLTRNYIKGSKTCWNIPVNLSESSDTRDGNYLGFLFFKYNSKKTIKENENNFYHRLTRGDAWGSVLSMYFVSLLGKLFTRSLIRILPAMQMNTGAFSYMKNLSFPDSFIVGHTPVTNVQPFSIATAEFNGMRTICFQAHSRICQSQDFLEKFADQYIESL